MLEIFGGAMTLTIKLSVVVNPPESVTVRVIVADPD